MIANGRHIKVIPNGRHVEVIANGRHIKVIANGRHVNVIAKETKRKDNFSGGLPMNCGDVHDKAGASRHLMVVSLSYSWTQERFLIWRP